VAGGPPGLNVCDAGRDGDRAPGAVHRPGPPLRRPPGRPSICWKRMASRVIGGGGGVRPQKLEVGPPLWRYAKPSFCLASWPPKGSWPLSLYSPIWILLNRHFACRQGSLPPLYSPSLLQRNSWGKGASESGDSFRILVEVTPSVRTEFERRTQTQTTNPNGTYPP